MYQIDFLPQRYHARRVQRRQRIWRAALLVLFGGLCAATAVGQQMLRRSVLQEVAMVEAQHAVAVATNQRFADMQQELRKLRAQAELYTYLKHPWPRTQIFAAVLRGVPQSVTLDRLHLSRTAPRSDRRSFRPARTSETRSDAHQPAEQDLAELRQQVDHSPLVLLVAGRTADTQALHNYVAALHAEPLLKQIELESLAMQPGAQEAEFTLRIVVRPGYGQPDGPSVASGRATRTASQTTEDQ